MTDDDQRSPAWNLTEDDQQVVRSLAPRAMPVLYAGCIRAPRLYLDQLHWIRLVRGRTGRDADASRLLGTVETLVAEGKAVLPLAAPHWAETWRRGNWRSRWRLAKVRWEVSGLASLTPFHEVVGREIDLELHRRFGRPAWPLPAQPLGVG